MNSNVFMVINELISEWYLIFVYGQGEEEPRGVRPAAKITIDKADPKVITRKIKFMSGAALKKNLQFS